MGVALVPALWEGPLPSRAPPAVCTLYLKWLGAGGGGRQQSPNRNQAFRHKGLTRVKDTQAIVGGDQLAGGKTYGP